jgi:YD repeat-containing protein
LSFHDGSRFKFPEAYYAKNYAQGAPIEMQDAGGHSIQFKRDGKRNLEQLISPSKHAISFKYDETDRIVEAADDSGNVRRYSYDSSGHLKSVADASHLLYRFEYTLVPHLANYDPYLMTSVVDGSGVALLKNIYDDAGRVSEQSLADGQVFRYRYVVDERFEIIETTVSGPTGERRFSFQGGVVVTDE